MFDNIFGLKKFDCLNVQKPGLLDILATIGAETKREKIGIGSKIGENDCESHLFGVHNLKMFASMHAGTKKIYSNGEGGNAQYIPLYIYKFSCGLPPWPNIVFPPSHYPHTHIICNQYLALLPQAGALTRNKVFLLVFF